MADQKISDFTTATTFTGLFLAGYQSGVNKKIAADTYFQPLDAELTAIAGLTSAANKLPYFTGSGTASLADFTSVGRTVVASASNAALLSSLGITGTQEIYINAGSFVPRSTNGADEFNSEFATNDVMVNGYAFSNIISEGIQIALALPKQWNNSTFTFQAYWTATSSSGTVIWSCRARAASDGDAIDGSWGTAQTSTDTKGTNSVMHISPVSSAITIGGTPATGDMIFIEVSRDISDTLATDAVLMGVKLFITTNAASDT